MICHNLRGRHATLEFCNSVSFKTRRMRQLTTAFGLSCLLFPGGASAQAASEMTTERVEAIVRDYLLRNPSLLREMSIALQRMDAAQAQERTRQALNTYRADLLNASGSPAFGNAASDVTVVEFFDFRCGYCKRAAPILEAVRKLDPKVRVVYKQMPILGPESVLAARASLAAHAQGKYETFHQALFALDAIDEKDIWDTAQKLGLDVARMRADMASEAVTQEIEANIRMSAPLGITGTPGFVIGNRVAPGMLDEAAMVQWIAQARNEKK